MTDSLIDFNQSTSDLQHYKSLSEKLKKIIEFSTDGIYVVNRHGKTILVNKAYQDITGYNRSELIGKNVFELTEKGYFDQSISKLVFKEKKQLSIVQKLGNVEKIGEKKKVVVTGSPVFNDNNELSFIVITVNDVSEITKIKDELMKARETSELNQHRFTFNQDSDQNETIIFRSKKMQAVYEQVEQIAPFPTSVLLSGESGVGKEVITNLIHRLSNRKEKPLIKINCGAIPENLLESELFGYEKGAFTGAKSDGKAGLLELAHEGTIMLDEIGEMPLSLQVKLLRVIQEKQVRRLGSDKTKDIDIRIISVTNKNLEELVTKGLFREDLYYRINVIHIDVPPLTERPEDVKILLEYFFDYFSKRYYIKKDISQETIDLLTVHHWPGNVRELRNLVENLIVSIPDPVIEPYHLPFRITKLSENEKKLTLKEKIQLYEQKLVYDALQDNSSIRETAKSLGIHHSTLVKKIQRWEAKK